MLVKIYTTPTCQWCRRVKEYFVSKNISYKEIDVTSNRDAAEEMIAISGQMGVPVIEIDGKIIVGYDPEAIDAALQG